MHHKRNRERKTIQRLREDIRKHFQYDSIRELLYLNRLDNPNEVYNRLEDFVRQNVRGITSSQLRKLFDLVPENPTKEDLLIQRPQFAHMIARQPNESAKNIMLLVDELAAMAGQDDSLKFGFQPFLKALVAYHKFYEVLAARRLDANKFLSLTKADFKQEKDKSHLDFNSVLQTLMALEVPTNVQIGLTYLDNFIGKNANGITSTQLRNIYDKILLTDTVKTLQELRPSLAYTAARQTRLESVKFIFFIQELLKCVKTTADLGYFKNVFEVIVSLHRYKEVFSGKKANVPNDLNKATLSFFEPHYDRLLTMNKTTLYGQIQDKIQEFSLIEKREGIKASQFRRLFDETMKAEKLPQLQLLEPLFLYTAARQSNKKAQQIILFFAQLLKSVKENQVTNFQDLMLDFMAYHRFFEEAKTKSKDIKINQLSI